MGLSLGPEARRVRAGALVPTSHLYSAEQVLLLPVPCRAGL